MLLSREYSLKVIQVAIESSGRQKTTDRPVFVIHYDPRLPSVNAIVKKHWRVMTQYPKLKEVFPDPPLIAYKRQKNLRQVLIRAKVPPEP